MKHMCYEMMIGVLEQHQLQAKNAYGYKATYGKAKKRKDITENLTKLSSINEEIEPQGEGHTSSFKNLLSHMGPVHPPQAGYKSLQQENAEPISCTVGSQRSAKLASLDQQPVQQDIAHPMAPAFGDLTDQAKTKPFATFMEQK